MTNSRTRDSASLKPAIALIFLTLLCNRCGTFPPCVWLTAVHARWSCSLNSAVFSLGRPRPMRSEERRVGKECSSRGSREHEEKKEAQCALTMSRWYSGEYAYLRKL